VIFPEGWFVVSPLQAHRIERLLHDEAAKLQRQGIAMRPEVVDLLRDVRLSAAVHRRTVTDATDENVSRIADVLPPTRILDIGVVVGLAGINRHAVADNARRGRLVGQKVGNRWQFDEVDVTEWLKRRKEIA